MAGPTPQIWSFYGRAVERAEIADILNSSRFFFCSISGRRRIGKTTLIREALAGARQLSVLYMQVPDTDERGIVDLFRHALEDSDPLTDLAGRSIARPDLTSVRDFRSVATTIGALCQAGAIVVLDEFQYFHRAALSEFTSHLQAEIDRLRDGARGGLFVLGSIHTEMTAILEDRNSPLFNRVSHRLELDHWDFATLFEMFDAHGVVDPQARLFLWSLFEGVPKFYRDAFEQGVLSPTSSRKDTLRRLFFEGASPLRDEAANWFLREMRGRNDSILKIIAREQPCSHGTLAAAYEELGESDPQKLSGYLKILVERYRMVEGRQPIFAKSTGRKARYEITDNFLSAWLAALSRNIDLARVRPIEDALARADISLQTHEGHAFEKMVRKLTEEASRRGTGDLVLSQFVQGYWNKAEGADIEIDLIAYNEEDRIVRFGSCKRSAAKHDSDALQKLEDHVARFLKTSEGKRFSRFTIQKVLYSPIFDAEARARFEGQGYLCRDLQDFAQHLAT